jgi:hypothetical protein
MAHKNTLIQYVGDLLGRRHGPEMTADDFNPWLRLTRCGVTRKG